MTSEKTASTFSRGNNYFVAIFFRYLQGASTHTDPIFDSLEDETLLKSMRILKQLPEEITRCNLLDLSELKASGSSQFTESGFIALVQALPLDSDQLVIVDLREERHGFVNGLPICWTEGLHSSLNSEELEQEENECVREVLAAGHVWIDEGKEQTDRLCLAISQAATEREFVESFGHRYVRFPVGDGNRLDDQLIDQFVQFILDSSPEQWFHFHCSKGEETTNTFLTLLDIIKNSQLNTLEEIISRHRLVSVTDQAVYVEEDRVNREQQRLSFISDFYAYCQEVSDFSLSWSEWISQGLSIEASSLASPQLDKAAFSKPQVEVSNQKIEESTKRSPKNSSKNSSKNNQKQKKSKKYSSMPKISEKHQVNSRRSQASLSREIVEQLPSVLFRHKHHSHHGGNNHGGGYNDNRGGCEGKITYKCEWGPDSKDTKQEWGLEGRANDGKGNFVDVKVNKNSDGTRSVAVDAGRENKKK